MSFSEALVSQITGGGWVNIPLLMLAAFLFYLLGYRTSVLLSSLNQGAEEVFNGKTHKDSLLNQAHLKLNSSRFSIKKAEHTLVEIKQQSHRYASLVTTLVSLAPLIGLLGTVIGMIETFSSLGDSSLFSASGGVAGGISQALITTQVGLIIAVPGLFISKFLKRIEKELIMSTSQLIELHKNKEAI